jgi:hypothetical protein
MATFLLASAILSLSESRSRVWKTADLLESLRLRSSPNVLLISDT